MRIAVLVSVVALLGACKPDVVATLPEPVAMTEDAVGFYCQMNLVEHEGPKGQVHLRGRTGALFFSQVRDTVAFLIEPEKVAPVAATYVTDMSRATSWQDPGDNWIRADEAFYVVASDAIGGMGAPELVPFGAEADAAAFAADHGGSVMRLDEIPADAVLGAVDRTPTPSEEGNRS